MTQQNDTQIHISKQTAERIKNHGRKGDTYNQILNKILDKIEGK